MHKNATMRLRDEDRDMRRVAAYALQRIGGDAPDADAALDNALAEPDASVPA